MDERKEERLLWNNKSTDQIRGQYCIEITDGVRWVIKDLSWLIVDYLSVDFRPFLVPGMKIEVLEQETGTWSAKSVVAYDASKHILTLPWNKTYSTKMECVCLSTLYTHTDPDNKLLFHFNAALVNLLRKIDAGGRQAAFPDFHQFCNDVFNTMHTDPQSAIYSTALNSFRIPYPELFEKKTSPKFYLDFLSTNKEVEPFKRFKLLQILKSYTVTSRSLLLSEFNKLAQLALVSNCSGLSDMVNELLPQPGTVVPNLAKSTFEKLFFPDMLRKCQTLTTDVLDDPNLMNQFMTVMNSFQENDDTPVRQSARRIFSMSSLLKLQSPDK